LINSAANQVQQRLKALGEEISDAEDDQEDEEGEDEDEDEDEKLD
jgi:hypothetical protein